LKQTTYLDNTRASSAKNSGSKWRTVALHIICWAIFLYVPALYNPHFENPRFIDILGEIVEPFRIANSIFFIILFYFNYLVAIPALYFTRRYPAFILYCIASLALLALVNFLIRPGFTEYHHHNEEHHHHHEHHFNAFRIFGPSFNFFIFITMWCISFTMCVYTKWRAMYDEKLNTEIAFLKAQINPHFLFNTLNSIYSLSLSGSEEAPEAILKLSGMMRYAVSETTHQFVSLEKEIEYIADYIELQKLRLTPDIKMDYNFTGDWTGRQIAPFLLIPFIENAFKYGVNAAESSAISVNIDVTGNELELRVDNKKVNIMHVDKGIGLGIGNTRKRLQLVYPGKHNLTIVDGEKDFKVTLKISLV
jgi:hypothetical protein